MSNWGGDAAFSYIVVVNCIGWSLLSPAQPMIAQRLNLECTRAVGRENNTVIKLTSAERSSHPRLTLFTYYNDTGSRCGENIHLQSTTP